MLTLGPSTSDLVRVVTGSAADVEASISYVTYSNATPPVVQLVDGEPQASITTATNTNLLTGAASTYTVIKGINLFNRSATSTTVSVEHNDASDTVALVFCTLLQNEALTFTESGLWVHYDANGGAYPNVGVAAVQSDQETATSTIKFVSPGTQQYHPSACKAWVTAGVTGNILASYNITSLTDTGTGDIAVTINVDFSSATYAVAMAVQRINSTAAEANERIGTIKTASLAAGSFSMDCWDTTTTTNMVKDPTTWHAVCFGDQ